MLLQKMDKTNVLIFKTESRENIDPYMKTLRDAGVSQSHVLPVLKFEFSNLDALAERLRNPQNYSGVIFTSERCVEGVELSLGTDCKTVMSTWVHLQIICVGPATHARLLQNLGIQAKIAEKQRADGIVESLTKDNNEFEKPFLYPCGELASAKDTLRTSLAENGIKCDPVTVYSTLPNPSLHETLAALCNQLPQDSFTVLVFFSPSGLKSALEAFEKVPNISLCIQDCHLVAIGPTTAEALKRQGFQVWAESSEPNPQCLCDAILEALKNVK